MAENKPLNKDERLETPVRLETAMVEAERAAMESAGWRRQYSTSDLLRAWARTIDDIGHYRPHGSDDYQHHLSYRMRLDRILVELQDLGYKAELGWLQREVDRLDQIFVERSTDDSEGLILRVEKDNPVYWFMRRVPNDKNVVDHLRMIQPKR